MNTPDFKIEPKLPVIAFNFEKLRAWAISITERSANLVITEDAISDVKKDMAELNKAKKAVDDARKEAVRRVSEPIRAFEMQIKEICTIFDDVYNKLSSQVKIFENEQREAKKIVIKNLIVEANMNAFNNPSLLDIPIQEKWLNKTTSLKSIKEDIESIIEQYFKNEQLKQAMENAKKDRAQAVESHIKALNHRYEMELPISRFIAGNALNLDFPLDQVLRKIDDVFSNEIELRQAEVSARETLASISKPKPAPVEQIMPKIEHSEIEPVIIVMSVLVSYDARNENAIENCLENLKNICASFDIRYR